MTSLGSPGLPYGRQCIDDADIAAVADVLRSDWLTTGPAVDRLEDAAASVFGSAHAVSCSSGTAALHIAVLAHGAGFGDVAIVPALTFAATANVIRLAGAEVVFADVDPDTGLMTPWAFEAALERAREVGPVKLVLPVHLNGQCCDMAAIGEIAARHGVAIIEDACHAIGAQDAGRCRNGSLVAFSLHPVKTITGGEGGLVATNSDGLAARMRQFRNHGITRDPAAFANAAQAFDADGAPHPWYYEIGEIGLNYRLSDIHAALAASQLSKLDAFVSRRRHLAALYDRALAPLAPRVRSVRRTPGPEPAWHLYSVLCAFDSIGRERGAVMAALREAGIGTQVHYIPVHRQPYYERRYGVQSLAGADAYYDRQLSLPLFPGMEDGDVDRVVEALRDACGL